MRWVLQAMSHSRIQGINRVDATEGLIAWYLDKDTLCCPLETLRATAGHYASNREGHAEVETLR